MDGLEFKPARRFGADLRQSRTRAINYRIAVALAGIVGTLCFPWQILNNLFVFLGYYGAFLSAIGGIMVADYYVVSAHFAAR